MIVKGLKGHRLINLRRLITVAFTSRSKTRELLQSNLSPNAPTFTSKPGHSSATSEKETLNRLKIFLEFASVKGHGQRFQQNFGDLLAKSDTGFKRCLLYKRSAKQPGISSPQTHLTMTLAGGQKRAEISEMIEIENASPADEDILKPVKAYTSESPTATLRMYHGRLLKSILNLEPIAD